MLYTTSDIPPAINDSPATSGNSGPAASGMGLLPDA